MKPKSAKRIHVSAPPELFELAKIVGQTPTAILEQFVQDLLRLPHSGGSDERDKAGEYFMRTGMVGFNHRNAVEDFISISRTEYRCQVCQKWVRSSDLRYVLKPTPHFACWDHPVA